jgi:hypothetical protein
MKRTAFLWFLAGNLLLCLFVFRDGLWGGSLLAPLDIASNLFPKYRYLDPAATGVPANSHIIDQIGYDLPLQRTIYESYQRREMPWWDPYTCGGRPFLADAHISAVDPVRVLWYWVLPFVLAYNWTLVTHFLLGGLAMFFWLRHHAFGQWICVWLAMAYEFAGCNALFFGHPWIHGAFVYYPLLWWLWEDALEKPGRWRTALASLFVAAVLMAGNLQSHSYIGVFAAAFCAGHGWTNRREWRRSLRIVVPSLIVGACLAAPFLSAEVELFLNNVRLIIRTPWIAWLSGIASLSTVYPWMLGTFRTLDVGKFVRQDGAGFLIYIGSIAAVLAFLACVTPVTPGRRLLKRKALALVILYGIIMSSPLRDFLAGRCAGMAVLGLTVLAAIGTEELFAAAAASRRLGRFVIGLAIALVVALNLAAFVIYPRVLPRVRKFVAERQRENDLRRGGAGSAGIPGGESAPGNFGQESGDRDRIPRFDQRRRGHALHECQEKSIHPARVAGAESRALVDVLRALHPPAADGTLEPLAGGRPGATRGCGDAGQHGIAPLGDRAGRTSAAFPVLHVSSVQGAHDPRVHRPCPELLVLSVPRGKRAIPSTDGRLHL